MENPQFSESRILISLKLKHFLLYVPRYVNAENVFDIDLSTTLCSQINTNAHIRSDRKHLVTSSALSATDVAKTIQKPYALTVRRTVSSGYNYDSISNRRPFDCNATALRPFDGLRHHRKPTYVWAAALQPA